MNTKNYLIIYGYSTRGSNGCYSENEISLNDIDKFAPLIKEIQAKENLERNWDGGIMLECENGKYVEHHLLYDLYPDVSPSILKEFSQLLPNNIVKIISIKVFQGIKIKLL